MKISTFIENELKDTGWLDILKPIMETPKYDKLRSFLLEEMKAEKKIYPDPMNIFRAFRETPLDSVKVVIVGQDPYHGPGQATGLAFGVRNGLPYPPSLRNIFKEVEREFGVSIPNNQSDLIGWARQGVLLLNSVLTVEHGKAASHIDIGWQLVTDHVIKSIGARQDGTAFMLWGEYAKGKAKLLPRQGVKVFETSHPSSFSAHLGFIGCDHFSAVNTYLEYEVKKTPIDWIKTSTGQTTSIGSLLSDMGLLR